MGSLSNIKMSIAIEYMRTIRNIRPPKGKCPITCVLSAEKGTSDFIGKNYTFHWQICVMRTLSDRKASIYSI